MGLGKTLKIMLTQRVKCENCGAVIVDGTYNSNPSFNDRGQLLPSYGGDGVGIFNTLKYGSKKKILCPMCEAAEKGMKNLENIISKENDKLAEHMALEKENLRLQNELLKQQLKNESMPNANRITPNVNQIASNVRRASNFCSTCGSALKQGARFCTKCGTNVN
jgi:hypothetical protein